MKRIRFKFFTLSFAQLKGETNADGSQTSYTVNQFLNSGIQPFDISCEFNQKTHSFLVSIGYYEEKSIFKTISDWLLRRGDYQVRFTKLINYDENSHSVYVQLDLENAINFNDHVSLSHGVFVDENSTAWVAFLEHKTPVEYETVIDPNHEKENE